MRSHPIQPLRRAFRAASLSMLLGAALLAGRQPVRAAEPYGNSLDWVPADVSFYSASLRLKEQVDILAASNAWQRLKEIPAIAMGWQMAEMQINNPQGPAAMFWQLMELPENKQLVELLGDMVSHEIVFYAGEDFTKTVELIQLVQGSPIAPIIQAIESGNPDGAEASTEARMEMVIEAVQDDPALADVPQIVLAFRVEDEEAAETQLARLEVLANMALQQSELGASFERQEIGDSQFIVLELNGTMLPWEGEAPGNFPGGEEGYEQIKEILSDKTLTVALGAWNNYLVISLGQSTEHLTALGEGPALGSREEFEPLQAHRDKKLVSLQYISREIAEQGNFNDDDLTEMADDVNERLQASDNVPEGLKERLSEDLPALADDMKRYIGKPGAAAGFQFLTATGFEGYGYNWTQQPRLDGSQPLEMTQHVGGSPLLALVSRGVQDPEDYEILAKWVGKAIGYIEDFALEQMDEDDRQEAVEALNVAKPLLARIDKTTREHLIPALADGQSAIVFDADIVSKQWHEEMPASFTPLPMAEFAIVVGVSDAEELMQAMAEYREIAGDAVDAIREKNPEAIPADYEIPDPETSTVDAGKLYAWPIMAGLDEQITLCGAVGDHVAALATSADLAERVLGETPLDAEGLGDLDQSRALVGGIDFAGLIGAIAPWVEYGIRMNFIGDETGMLGDPADDPEELQDICSQVGAGLEIMQCFRGAWVEKHEQDGVWVTHSVTTFKDLDE